MYFKFFKLKSAGNRRRFDQRLRGKLFLFRQSTLYILLFVKTIEGLQNLSKIYVK